MAEYASQQSKVRVGIIGGAGYTGGELIRILINHPDVEIAFVLSKSNAGKPVSDVHADLVGETGLNFTGEEELTDTFAAYADVLFLCVGHGDAKQFLNAPENSGKTGGIRIIDLSQDFRLHVNGVRPTFLDTPFIYGLPELNKAEIRTAKYVANPGCFATSIQLGLLPLASAGLLTDVYSTGITGSTGAGQSLSPTSHFSWRANNIQAYKGLQHQHVKEISQSLQQLQPDFQNALTSSKGLHFVPWRGDFTRGIYISSTLDCTLAEHEVNALYQAFYKDQPFTFVSEKMVDMKQVVNTNKCLVHVEKVQQKIVVHSTIDNLVKGASGQAVQNMNLMFGLDEGAGIRLKANAF
ncbi:N-acetyl-gamma-glutamyl-phosphate reductase [Segetibacter sp. 3557_3]|uniref:N-acetyl-gamma-glutamyl-phosphate reductase n=1 Tax=Segetibacter sp. 3557_3 TaxID=2547429 RepID=UPI001058ADD3|nr:N-acetyl-gamma-glutamyl-phosphate reductase [Segetibacter sp. 3557_3]TDH25110.1 N-acetyl-gamma-glutamyl-phosphate reductase [Segetibacter sp. 3557_3]